MDRFRSYLAAVWKQVRAKQRTDLEARLTEIAGQAARPEPAASRPSRMAVIRDARRLGAEVHKIEELAHGTAGAVGRRRRRLA